jgi:hypothetical protein
MARRITRCASIVVLGLAVASTRGNAQGAGTSTRATAQKTISRARLDEVLGRSTSSIRVVRTTGVSDLRSDAGSVGIGPGDFVFRKMADTARRIRNPAIETRPNGRRGAPGTAPAPAPPGAANAELTPASIPALSSAATTYVMPYRWLTIDSAGVERVLVPFFILASGGLTYDVESRTYRGLALVGLEDTLHSNAGVTLPRPLKLLLTTTTGGTVTPLVLAIGHTSLDYDSVRIESTDSTNLRIRTGADPAGIVIPIPVRSMSVAMIPQQPTLQGLGLATTDIAISLPRGITRRDTATITFSATGAPVRPSSVRMSGSEVPTVRLRSGLPGADSISAYLDGVRVGGTVVTFVMPWAFFGATLIGIVIGGLARFFGGKRWKRARMLGRDIMRSFPFGLMAAVAGAIGLDWMHLKLDDPAALPAIVITAALGAWLGSRLLDSAVARPSAPAESH